MGPQPDVLVLGTGPAGLSAAVALHARWQLVLEERGRVGGRMCTTAADEGPLPLELGAEFLHASRAD